MTTTAIFGMPNFVAINVIANCSGFVVTKSKSINDVGLPNAFNISAIHASRPILTRLRLTLTPFLPY